MGILKSNKGLEVLYTDTFSIYRPTIVKDQWGGAINKDILISENNPCRLSQMTVKGSNSVVSSSEQEFRLFIPLNIEVLQNDRLEVRRGYSKYTARASQPFKYLDILPHQEVVLREVVENEDWWNGWLAKKDRNS